MYAAKKQKYWKNNPEKSKEYQNTSYANAKAKRHKVENALQQGDYNTAIDLSTQSRQARIDKAKHNSTTGQFQEGDPELELAKEITFMAMAWTDITLKYGSDRSSIASTLSAVTGIPPQVMAVFAATDQICQYSNPRAYQNQKLPVIYCTAKLKRQFKIEDLDKQTSCSFKIDNVSIDDSEKLEQLQCWGHEIDKCCKLIQALYSETKVACSEQQQNQASI